MDSQNKHIDNIEQKAVGLDGRLFRNTERVSTTVGISMLHVTDPFHSSSNKSNDFHQSFSILSYLYGYASAGPMYRNCRGSDIVHNCGFDYSVSI